jgi:hypothetical protein
MPFNRHSFSMEALAVTIFLSLLLAAAFVVMFLGSHRGIRTSMEQEALLPLDQPKTASNPHQEAPPHHVNH